MLKVGITGGMGSGKSLVCQIFKQLGIPIYQADTEAKNLYFTNSQLKFELISAFGSQVYLSDNELNKPFLRDVLKSPETREILNSIVHPKVFEHFEHWAQSQKTAYVLKEAAILFESGANKTVDTTIAVIADPEIRLNRVLNRDHLPEEQIRSIMNSQLSNEELISRCKYIIYNNGNESLIEQVLAIHQQLLHQATHFGG